MVKLLEVSFCKMKNSHEKNNFYCKPIDHILEDNP